MAAALWFGSPGCSSGLPAAGSAQQQAPAAPPDPAPLPPAATDELASLKGDVALFNAERAFKDLEKQVAFGPRVPGTEGHARCRDWIAAELRAAGAVVKLQEWSLRLDGKLTRLANIIAAWPGRRKTDGILLSAHWDTRPTADAEFTPALRSQPIPGANDGASGVAVLLETARLFRLRKPPVPVMMVFFDGEDYGPGLDKMFLGSREFARDLPRGVPRRGALLDMVGDRDLQIPREQISRLRAPAVQNEIYALAATLGHAAAFPDRQGPSVQDDHVPLLDAGLEVVDLIDFSYGPNHSWWHTHADTPDKCSPASLRAVGETVAGWVLSQQYQRELD